MPKRSIADADVAGKRVLARVDFNVPMRDGQITDDTRIQAALPTIRNLLDRGAAVILATHFGRPKGKPNPDFSVAPIAGRLRELVAQPVLITPAVAGPEAERSVARLAPGQVLLLENTRFEPGEEANDPALAEALARLADLFVNDAFGAAHRAHASTVGVASRLPAYAGLLLQREEAMLARLLDAPEHPFVTILGGAKVSDKLGVIKHLLARVDALLLGGGMANTVLLAQGFEIGASLAEPDRVADANSLLTEASERSVQLGVPTDVVVAPGLDTGQPTIVSVDDVPQDQAIFDIGPETIDRYCELIARARTVFWNGPMGVFEQPAFAKGTMAIAHCVAKADAFTVIGGGDSVAAVESAGVADAIDHISTGGGASLEFLEGRTLPGIAALPDA
jgi:phosphoglycerate kinase